jgi:hypothetical protein
VRLPKLNVEGSNPFAPGRLSGDGVWLAYAYAGASSVQEFNRLTGVDFPVSVPTGGTSGISASNPSISADGRYVSFESDSSLLEVGDTNGKRDIFIHDRVTGSTWRASIATNGAQGNGDSMNSWISGDGRYVVFQSSATNLAPNDNNGTDDIFVRDRQAGTTILVSIDSLGIQGNRWSGSPTISEDGRTVTFYSLSNNLIAHDGNRLADVFAHDLVSGVTRRISVAADCTESDGYSAWPTPMMGGRWTAFVSFASNLVPGDTNGYCDVFVRDCTLDSDCGSSPSTTFCAGDGTGTACPCGNTGQSGRGCDNSLSTGGGLLDATGFPSVLDDSVRLTASSLLPGTSVLFFQGTSAVAGGAGAAFGDGLRCVGGSVERLGIFVADSSGQVSMGYGVPMSPGVAAAGVIPAGGQLRYYQLWYRNAAPFCQPQGYNLTNGIALSWTF